MKLHLKHPIFDILFAYTSIDEFYVCGGYVRNRQICYDGIPKDVKKVVESIVWGGQIEYANCAYNVETVVVYVVGKKK